MLLNPMQCTEFSSDISFYRKASNFAEKCCSLLDTKISGAPIIQDGKLIGTVPHVLVQDSTRGYGIFIENMLEH